MPKLPSVRRMPVSRGQTYAGVVKRPLLACTICISRSFVGTEPDQRGEGAHLRTVSRTSLYRIGKTRACLRKCIVKNYLFVWLKRKS